EWALVGAEVHLGALHARLPVEVERQRLRRVAVAVEVERIGREERREAGVYGGGGRREPVGRATLEQRILIEHSGALGASLYNRVANVQGRNGELACPVTPEDAVTDRGAPRVNRAAEPALRRRRICIVLGERGV